MRSHQDIVTSFGASKLAHALKELGREIATNTPQRWGERDRIPSEWWDDLVAVGAATFDELRATHRPRKRPEPVTAQDAA